MNNKYILIFVYLLFLSFNSFASGIDPKESFSIFWDKMPLQQAVLLYYDQCEKRGVVIDSTVSKLDEPITVKTPTMNCFDYKSLLSDSLRRAGIRVESKGTYDLLLPGRVVDERDTWSEFIYRPRFRDALDLSEMVMIAVRKGSFAHQKRSGVVQVAAGAASSQVPDNGSNGSSVTAKLVDKLVFFGPGDECTAVKSLLSKLDTPTAQVEISVGIYEFQSSSSVGSAINAAVSIFKSKIGLTIAGAATAGSTLKLNLPSIDAALSLLDEDSRFKYVARPRVLAKDGEQVTFTGGQDVRVVGGVSIDRNGNQVQSIVTINAGVTLQATPLIRDDVVDLTLHQVVSDFVASPNNDPSVVKRDLTNRLVLQPGFVYIVGGLQTTRKTQSKKRFFGFSVGDSFESSDTEIIILLSVTPDKTVASN